MQLRFLLQCFCVQLTSKVRLTGDLGLRSSVLGNGLEQAAKPVAVIAREVDKGAWELLEEKTKDLAVAILGAGSVWDYESIPGM